MQIHRLINRFISIGAQAFTNMREHGHEITPRIVEGFINANPKMREQLPDSEEARKKLYEGIAAYYKSVHEASSSLLGNSSTDGSIAEGILDEPHAQEAVKHGSIALVEGVKALSVKLMPVVQAAFESDYEEFKAKLPAILGTTPEVLQFHLDNILYDEKAFAEMFNVVIGTAPEITKIHIIRKFEELIEIEAPADTDSAKAWLKEFHGLVVDSVNELFTDEVKGELTQISDEIQQKRLEELKLSAQNDPVKFFSMMLGLPVTEEDLKAVVGSCSSVPVPQDASLNDIAKQFMALLGLPQVELQDKEPKDKTATDIVKPAGATEIHISVENKTETGNQVLNQANKLVPWIIALAGAVTSLGGYQLTEEKGRGLLSGTGSLGLVASVTALIKRYSQKGEKSLGWLEGKGSWIMGLGSAALASVPLYFSENKIKNLMISIGLGAIGGVLAWFFEPVRAIFGLPAKLENAAPKPAK